MNLECYMGGSNINVLMNGNVLSWLTLRKKLKFLEYPWNWMYNWPWSKVASTSTSPVTSRKILSHITHALYGSKHELLLSPYLGIFIPFLLYMTMTCLLVSALSPCPVSFCPGALLRGWFIHFFLRWAMTLGLVRRLSLYSSRLLLLSSCEKWGFCWLNWSCRR